MRNFSIPRSLLLAGLLFVPAFNPVAAQQPTQAERDAIRSACRSDFLTHCANVQPGGKEALECLLQNDSKLSASCKSAVAAVAPKPEPKPEPKSESKSEPKSEPATKEAAPAAPEAPAAATPKAAAERTQDDQIKAIRRACTLEDFMAHCSWISPNSAEVMLCLKANAAGLSPPCRAAVGSLSNTAGPSPVEPRRQEQPASRPNKSEPTRANVSPSSPSVTAAKTAHAPTSQQRNAIRAACRSDFVSHCSGVQPGGTKAFQCLQRNEAQLSAPCKSAVAAIAGGATASPSAAPSESTPPAAVTAPLAPMPTLRPREALALLRICREDMQLLCAGIPSGGGRIISCLAEKSSSLSPGCYGALAAARRY